MHRVVVMAVVMVAAALGWPARAEVLIGLATALTGPVAWEGASSQVGVDAAVAQLNAQGGVLGERIEVIAVDDACAADQAVVAARKLIDAGVVAVIGHHCSAASIPASQLYAKVGILMISAFSSNPKVTEQGFRTVFRVQGRDDRQGEMAGDLLAERFGHKPIAILHDGTVYGRDLAGYTKARLNERGAAEAIFEAIEPGQLDYSDVIRRMQAARAAVLYYAGFTQEAGLIFRQVRESGSDLQLVAGDAVAAEDFGLIAGPAADGALMTYLASPPATAGNALLAEQFAAKGYSESFGLGSFRSYAAVQAWARAVERAGTFAPAAFAEVLHTHQFDTVLGRIGFDEKGDVTGYGTYVWHVWKDGEFAPLEPSP
jgi:branched-chain amino acid transport system substrate-binding protein